MALVSPYKTNYPVKLQAWTGGTLQETKIPHTISLESRSRLPKRDSHRVLVLNPAFQRLNHAIANESEEDMEPTVMQPPRRQGHPRKVTKTEKLNVLRECQWQVSEDDARDECTRGRTPLSRRSLVVVLAAVCFTSLLSIILTLLLLFGTVRSRSCPCNGWQGGAPSFEKQDGGYLDEMRGDMTSLEKRLITRIEQLEQRSEEKDKLVTYNFETLRKRLEVEERNSNESSKMLVQHSKGIASLEKSLNSTRENVKKLSLVWISVNSTEKELKQQTQALWTASNSTRQDVHSLWREINSTSTKFQKQLEEVNSNLSGQVTNNVAKLKARIEIEEQKSNASSHAEVWHSQDIAALQSSLNSTREDIARLSLVWISVNSTQKELQQQKQLLGLAENSTQKEIRKVWTAVNVSNTDIQQQLMEVNYNFTMQLNNTRNLFHSRDTSLFATLVDVNSTLTDKVNDITKMSGPAGPRGYNGSQGLPGAQGPAGPPGSRGAGDFSQCRHQVADSGGTSPGPTAATDIAVIEHAGKKIVGATCSTNFAAEYVFAALVHGGTQRYSCECRGQAAHFPITSAAMHCYLHYWECPTTT